MTRWLLLAVLGVALLTLPAWGQRRGGGIAGHGGFGGHSSFPHPMGGGFRGPMHPGSFSGVHSGGWGNGFHHGPFPHNGCWNCFHHHHHFNGYPWGNAYGYWPYAYAGWDYPWYDDYPSDNDADNYQSQAPPNDYYAPPDYQSQAEIDRLHEEVAQLRDEVRASSSNIPDPPAPKESAPDPTQLVFADKHTEQVENYAIVRQNLWVFDGSRTRKIPLASLDIPATQKANQDQGVDFQIPD